MNQEVLSKAMKALRALYDAGKSDRKHLAKSVKNKEELRGVLSRRFRSHIGQVVEKSGLQTLEEKQQLNMALLREFSAEARGEDQEVLALVS